MIELGGYRGVLNILGVYAIVIFILGGSLIAWAGYNIRRFSGKDRRTPRPVVTVEMQAKQLHVQASELADLQKSQWIVIEHGHIQSIQMV